jgi:polyhydroxybutyrate depolymerase
LLVSACGLGIGASSLSAPVDPRLAVEKNTAAAAAVATNWHVPIERVKSIHAGSNKLSIEVDGTKRTFTLFQPQNLRPDEKAPVVFVLHGAFGDGNTARWNVHMNEQARKRNFFLIYPDAMGIHTWNAGACCGIGKWRETKDVQFISATIDFMESRMNADPKRIFVAGESNGGMMAYRLGIELSDKIAAISPVEGAMEFAAVGTKDPISVIVFHGKRDHVIRYDGKPGRWLFMRVYAPSVSECIQYWVHRNHCSDQPITEQHKNFDRDLYKNGDAGTEVCLYTLNKGSHTWPGSLHDSMLHPIRSKEFSAAEVMCDFFLAHPKATAQ